MIRYRDDERLGLAIVDAPEPYLGLARWMADEIGRDFSIVLDALEFVDAAYHKRELPGEWSSEGYAVLFDTEALTIGDLWDESGEPPLRYPIGEAKEAIEEYAVFVMSLPDRANEVREFRPDLRAWQAWLLWWEQYWKRRHSYRGRLGIPETGPA